MVWLKRHVRLIAMLLLLAVTGVGLYAFLRGDWQDSLRYWEGQSPVLLLALALQGSDILFDSFLWALCLREMGIHIDTKRRTLIFMAGYAGLLLPLQLGRFIRSEAIGRLGLGSTRRAVAAESVLLVLTAVANGAVLATVVMSQIYWPLAPVPGIILILAFLFVANRVFALITHEKFRLPAGFWWRPRIIIVAFLASVGWYVNGTVLYLVTRHLPQGPELWQALFIGPSNLLAGVLTGLPGGIGAVEGFLGLSLSFVDMPPAHLALAVAAFRLVTFWFWIPVGWLAFMAINRMMPRPLTAVPAGNNEVDA